jgi:hypothetical protein
MRKSDMVTWVRLVAAVAMPVFCILVGFMAGSGR